MLTWVAFCGCEFVISRFLLVLGLIVTYFDCGVIGPYLGLRVCLVVPSFLLCFLYSGFECGVC